MWHEPVRITSVERRQLPGEDRWAVDFAFAVAGAEVSGTLMVGMEPGCELTQEKAIRVVHNNLERLVLIALRGGLASMN